MWYGIAILLSSSTGIAIAILFPQNIVIGIAIPVLFSVLLTSLVAGCERRRRELHR